MPIVLGIKKRFELMQRDPSMKENLWNIVNKLQTGLRERGFNIGDVKSCVTPVFLDGTPFEASQLVYDMRENYGVFCSMVIFPMIPKGTIILRMIPTAAHTEQDVEDTLEAFTAIGKKLKEGFYKDEVPELIKS
jgi:glycine C-acetyltransferase